MAIESVEIIKTDEHTTVDYGKVVFHFVKTKNVNNWNDYLSDAEEILEKWEDEFNPIGISSLLGAICILLEERENGKR